MKSLTTALLSVFILAWAAMAQAAPPQGAVLEGVWKMLPDKSDFGPMPNPGTLTLTIKVKGAIFEADQETPEGTQHLVFRTDGKETVNPLPDGNEMKSRHWFEGNVLRGELVVGEMTFKDRISYSPDGRLMTLERHIEPLAGDSTMKVVLEKAEPAKPSMAGLWKLDPTKSDFGSAPTPAKYDAKITVDGHVYSMQMSTDQGDSEIKFRDDGQETTNQVANMAMKSKMWWDKDVLVGEDVYTGNGVEMTFKDRTSFSPDGKLMTTDRVGQTPSGERKLHIVMVKQ
jgi:hypothetical protein